MAPAAQRDCARFFGGFCGLKRLQLGPQPVQQALEGLSQVDQQMPAIGDLNSLRGAQSDPPAYSPDRSRATVCTVV